MSTYREEFNSFYLFNTRFPGYCFSLWFKKNPLSFQSKLFPLFCSCRLWVKIQKSLCNFSKGDDMTWHRASASKDRKDVYTGSSIFRCFTFSRAIGRFYFLGCVGTRDWPMLAEQVQVNFLQIPYSKPGPPLIWVSDTEKSGLEKGQNLLRTCHILDWRARMPRLYQKPV